MAIIDICGFWKKEKKSGGSYLSGGLRAEDIKKLRDNLREDLRLNVAIFKNDNKKSDNHPDYRLVVLTRDQEQQTKPEAKPDYPPPPPEDDIPF